MVAVSAANPFPGLRPFDFPDRDFFFGREGQIRELRRKLKSNHFIAVVGSSGSGKSSLVRAGLCKFLDQEGGWRWITIRPQGEPLGQLALAILEFHGRHSTIPLDIQVSRTETALRRSSSGVVDLLAEGKADIGGPILIVVDQFEELFRFERPEDLLRYLDEAQAFVQLLLQAARSPDLPIHVILTMRSDFLGDCARFPGLPEAINDSQFLVPRLTRDERRQAIERPIEKAGAKIEPALLQRLLNDAGDDPDQLPVLQHVLMRTWQVASRDWATERATFGLSEAPACFAARGGDDSRVLRLVHYEHDAVGGMDHALSHHADAVLEKLEGDQSELAAKQIFSALVDIDREGRAIRRTPPPHLDELVAIVGDQRRAMEVVDAFRATDCSFLVPSFDDLPEIDGDRRIDIAHEALIRRWTKISGKDGASGWLAEETADGRIYRRLLDFIDEFGEQRGLGADEAAKRVPWWSPVRHNAAWAERYGGRFDQVTGLIERSKVEVRRAALRRLGLYALILLPVVVAAGAYATLNWMQERDLREKIQTLAGQLLEQQRELTGKNRQLELQQKELTEKNNELEKQIYARVAAEDAERKERSRVLAKQSMELTSSGDAATGLALALAATQSTKNLLPTAEAEQAIYLALGNLHQELSLSGDEGPINATAFSPDGTRMVSGFGAPFEQIYGIVKVWDTVSGEELLVLRGHEDWVRAAAFSPDGTRIVSASDDMTIRVWDAVSGEELLVLRGHEDWVRAAAFSPDSWRIVSGSDDGTIRVWDAVSGEELSVLRGHGGYVLAASFSPDGSRIVSASNDMTIRVWDAVSGEEPLVLRGHEGPIYAAAFSPTGTQIVSGSGDSTVRTWDAVSGRELLVLRGHEGSVNAAAPSPDGARIVSGADDATVRVWDAASGVEVLVLGGHEGSVHAAAFAPDGRRIVSGSDNGTALIWRVAAPMESITYRAFAGERDPLSSLKANVSGPASDNVKVNVSSPASDNSLPRALVGLAGNGLEAGRADVKTGAALWLQPAAPARRISILAPPLALHQGERHLHTVDDQATLVTLGPEDASSFDLLESNIAGAAFGDVAELVLLTTGGELAWFTIAKGAPLRTYRVDTSLASEAHVAMDLASDGRRVLAAAADGRTLRTSGRTVEALSVKGPEGRVLSVNANADLVATAQATRAGDRVIVWRAADGQVVAELSIPMEEGQVLEAAISPDGQRVLTAAASGPLRLWDLLDTSVPVALFGRSVDRFTGAAFAADGRRIAAAQVNGDVKVWPIFASREELIKTAAQLAPRELTFAQKCRYNLAEESECQEVDIVR